MSGKAPTVIDRAREALSRRLFSPLQGMTFGAWRALLRQDGCAVDRPYRPRAAFQTAVSLVNEGVARLEAARFGAAVAAAEVRPPVFVLGHFRHGTTHLHNLLGLDP